MASTINTNVSSLTAQRALSTSNLSLSVDYMNYLDSGGASVNGYSLSLGLRF